MLYISKEMDKNTPEIHLDGQILYPSRIEITTWVNGDGAASEHVLARLNLGHKHPKEFKDGEVTIDLALQCGLVIRSTERGLGCFFNGKRIALVQKLNYVAGHSVPPWPYLTIELSAV